jgi:hypothetical protein
VVHQLRFPHHGKLHGHLDIARRPLHRRHSRRLDRRAGTPPPGRAPRWTAPRRPNPRHAARDVAGPGLAAPPGARLITWSRGSAGQKCEARVRGRGVDGRSPDMVVGAFYRSCIGRPLPPISFRCEVRAVSAPFFVMRTKDLNPASSICELDLRVLAVRAVQRVGDLDTLAVRCGPTAISVALLALGFSLVRAARIICSELWVFRHRCRAVLHG